MHGPEMTLATRPTSPAATAPMRAGSSIDADAFAAIRRRMMLEFCKWDTQVGDVATLADFPLVLSSAAWDELCAASLALTRETLEMESRLLQRPDLWGTI